MAERRDAQWSPLLELIYEAPNSDWLESSVRLEIIITSIITTIVKVCCLLEVRGRLEDIVCFPLMFVFPIFLDFSLPPLVPNIFLLFSNH